MREMTKQERETAFHIIQSHLDFENYGMTAPTRYRGTMRERMDFRESGWFVDWNHSVITLNDEVAYRIHKKYASRKVNGMYKCLKPTIEYTGSL